MSDCGCMLVHWRSNRLSMPYCIMSELVYWKMSEAGLCSTG